jgi:hypothetical protein
LVLVPLQVDPEAPPHEPVAPAQQADFFCSQQPALASLQQSALAPLQQPALASLQQSAWLPLQVALQASVHEPLQFSPQFFLTSVLAFPFLSLSTATIFAATSFVIVRAGAAYTPTKTSNEKITNNFFIFWVFNIGTKVKH